MTYKLVIVESPTKARTLSKFLGKDYRIEASMGHVRDLPANAEEIPADIKDKPWSRLGIDIESGFAPVYVIPKGKKKTVTELKKLLKGADELFIATDEDREGESIGWHLVQLLQPKVPTRRMVFHEITKTAIQHAIEATREIDQKLVEAQETRRVLDRLVGYTLSPMLWKKVKPKLSAGRVQSVAVRLLVLRERERMAFHAGTYWDIKAHLAKDNKDFHAQLVAIDGVRLATGKDFDENTGKIREDRKVLLLEEDRTKALAAKLRDSQLSVDAVETRDTKRSPGPPFITSTLQQEGNKKLGLSARDTMSIAQRLYEAGYITYMRTDSTHLSDEAIRGTRGAIASSFGEQYLSEKVRQYKTSSKGAQEAHEAIRPAGDQMRTAAQLGLKGKEAAVYDLIWKRTMATQMAEAKLRFTTVTWQVNVDGEKLEFKSFGKEITFPGYFLAYQETLDVGESEENDEESLPPLTEGERHPVKDVEPLGHETKPPARYTEASLVKALEKDGVGRPSTYATIIDTIQQRGYVFTQNKTLIPTFTAMAVTNLLEQTHGDVVDVEFTAGMEEKLDEIAEGKTADGLLKEFYDKELIGGIESGGDLDPRTVCTLKADSFAPYEVRVGRYGPFVEIPAENPEEKATTVSLPEGIPPADVTKDVIEDLVAKAKLGNEPIGQDAESGRNVYVLVGRFGPYVQLGENDDEEPKSKKVSLPKGLAPEDVTLDKALDLLSLPRRVGLHPEDGKVVNAGIGRFGPYVVHAGKYASLKPEDDVLTVNLDRAVELLAAKKQRGGQEPLRTIGNHPETGEPIAILDGRFGPYVKHQKTNASLPKDMAPEDVSLEQALDLLAAREARKGAKKTTKAKTAKKKTAAKTTKAKKKA
ncbi:MAG: type I DNA topoisomerase [Deltaproteobacteria bacterium]|nr:type I DNA topoisomerase [Deltaproteobacteria bacterium]MCB9488692.1 type I DNA topoisomerase [Deltaproteobacteria bacterium]